MDFAVIDLEDFDFTLPEKSDGFLPMNDTQGFIRRVEQEGHFHSTTSFPTEAPFVRRALNRSGVRSDMFYAIRSGRNQAQRPFCRGLRYNSVTILKPHV